MLELQELERRIAIVRAALDNPDVDEGRRARTQEVLQEMEAHIREAHEAMEEAGQAVRDLGF